MVATFRAIAACNDGPNGGGSGYALVVHPDICAIFNNEPEPAGGVQLPDSDAPRMDATDSDGFSQTCLFILFKVKRYNWTRAYGCWESSD